MSDVVYLLGLFVQQLIGTFYLYSTGEPKKSFMMSVIAWYLPMAAAYGLFSLIFPQTPEPIQAAVRALILLGFIMFMFGGSVKQRLISYLSFYLITFALEFTSLLLNKLFFNIMPQFEYLAGSDDAAINYMRIIFNDFLFYVLVCIITVKERKKLRKNGSMTDIHILGMFVLLHFLFLVFHTKLDGAINDEENLLQLSFQMLLFTLVLLHYHTSLKRRELMKAEQELEQLRTIRELEYNYYLLANEKLDAASKLRHEIQNQLAAVQSLMNRPDGGEEAHKLIDGIQQDLSEVKTVNYCDDRTVNAIMTVKLSDERLKNIDITTELHDCGSTGLEPAELCSLFANIFDNAAEACLASGADSGCFISMKCGIKNGMFLLRCSNSTAKPLELSTSKGEGHGYGLRIVSEICERHGGEFTLSSENDTVKATAAILISDKR